jgi:hypothetical protein
MTSRQTIERNLVQGADEQIIWSLTTTPWGSSPTSVTVVAKDIDDDYNPVSDTVLSGSASVSGDVITLPTLKSLTAGKRYRIEVKFTVDGQILEAWFLITGQR